MVRPPHSAAWRIAQDLSDRLGIAAGLVAADDALGDLEHLIREKFRSRRAFCQATGLAEDMLSHVLAGRKDLSLRALEQALRQIGYALHIRPAAGGQQPARKAAARKRTG